MRLGRGSGGGGVKQSMEERRVLVWYACDFSITGMRFVWCSKDRAAITRCSSGTERG